MVSSVSPVIKPFASNTVHVYVVSAGTISVFVKPPPSVGVTLKSSFEQIAPKSTSSIDGLGSTSTVTVKSSPTQIPSVPEVGVTV